MPALVGVVALDLVQSARADIGNAAAGDDAFLDRRAGRVQRVSTRPFFLISFRSPAPTLTIATPPASLAYPLLQLFLVVIAGGFFDLGAECSSPAPRSPRIAGPVDEGGLSLSISTRFAWPGP